MKNTIYFLFIFFFSLGVSQENEWRWQQEVDYTMVIDVDVENHTYKGAQSIIYTNNSPAVSYTHLKLPTTSGV